MLRAWMYASSMATSPVVEVKYGEGRGTGEEARDALVEWMFRVRKGPRKGLVEGV